MPLMRPGLIAGTSAGRGDALATPDARDNGRRRLIAFAVLGIASYALAMVATLPASVAFRNKPWRTGVSGTVWNGEVGVTGGSVVKWSWSPLRSLTSLGYAADFRVTGPDTDLGGRVLAGFSSKVFDKVSGSANVALLQVLQPNLPFTCEMTAQVEIERAEFGGSGQMMKGTTVSDPGSCAPRIVGGATQLPSLIMTSEKIGTQTRIRVAPAAQRLKTLLNGTLSESGELVVSLTPEGADAMPFMGLRAGVPIHTKL
jgi:Type II secretion system (T2SS), protein N